MGGEGGALPGGGGGGGPAPGGPRGRAVLGEGEYLGALGAIVERDFFPGLGAARARAAWAEARGGAGAALLAAQGAAARAAEGPAAGAPGMTLDEFCARYTSEDNASFLEIQGRDATRARERRPWLLGAGPGDAAAPLYGDPAPPGGLALTAAERPRRGGAAAPGRPSVNPAATRFAGQEPLSVLPTPQGSERCSPSPRSGRAAPTPSGGGAGFSVCATPRREEAGRGLAEAAARRKAGARRGGGRRGLSPAASPALKGRGATPLSRAGQKLAHSLGRTPRGRSQLRESYGTPPPAARERAATPSRGRGPSP